VVGGAGLIGCASAGKSSLLTVMAELEGVT
jgi:predicted ABC-type transport system involved in lysophospholipase L1 biosynthesis ATPase subunit